MKRRVLAVAAAAATAVAVMPAMPAFAAASATTALTSAKAVYPGAQTVTLTVTNTQPAGVLGVGAGKTIDALRVTFPVDQAGISLGASPGTATGFTDAKSTNLGSTQYTIFRKGSGAGIAPGTSTTISLPVTVAAPSAKDLTGAFRVAVSDDNFATSTGAAGDLAVKVQVLEILSGSLKPVAPAGVTDRSGTGKGGGFGGQLVTYEAQVKNHAASALPVTVGLSSNGPDTATASTPTIASGETRTVSIPLQLGDAAVDRTASLTATATSGGTAAVAPSVTDAFSVQAPVTLPLSGLSPDRWRTGTNSARDFTVTATKSGSPAVTALTGTLLPDPAVTADKCAVKNAPTFGRGGVTGSITFGCPDLTTTAPNKTVVPTASGTLTDDNGASYGYSSTLNTLVLDNIAPILADVVTGLPKDRDGMQQTAVKQSGDVITVGGTIANAGDLASSNVAVTLTPDSGTAQTFTVPVSGSGETRTFSGTYTLKDWGTAAKTFTTKVAASDTVGNTGEADGAKAVSIDRTPAVLKTPGTIVDASTIEVQFTDDNKVAGGCTAALYLVDGRPGRVTSVRTGDGSACDQLGNGVRLLTVSPALGPDDTPTVTYDPTGARQAEALGQKRFPLKDGAGIDALRQVANTVTQIVPATPGIVKVERKDSASSTGAYEPAYLDTDETRYYTNVPGDGAVRLTVNQVRSGYKVEVTRGGAVVTSVAPAAPLGTVNNASYEASVLVPVADVTTPQLFEVRLISTQGKPSDPAAFTVVLDKLGPALGTVTKVVDGQLVTITAGLSEKVVAGSDFSDNWLACEAVQRESGAGEVCVPPDSVTGGSLDARTLKVSTFENPNNYKRVGYHFESGSRYEDRAGNLMADTI